MVLSQKRLERRIEKLCSNFPQFITKFNNSNQFTGPTIYFHLQTIKRRRDHKTLETLFGDTLFFEYLYAALTSWGLHRMGKGNTKLKDFKTFVDGIRGYKNAILELQDKKEPVMN